MKHKEFVTIEKDKFTNVIRGYTTQKLYLNCIGSFRLDYSRTKFSPSHDSLSMSLSYDNDPDGYKCLKQGYIIMLINGKPITVHPSYDWQHCSTDIYEGKIHFRFSESCTYNINRQLLKLICDSKSFAMKIYGGAMAGREISNVNAFVVYSKLFYNAVYDRKAYTNVVANALNIFTHPDAEMSSFSEIALDGSGARVTRVGCLFRSAITLAFIALAVVIIGFIIFVATHGF